MGKKERLEREIDYLKEKYKSYFMLLLALLSGEAGLIYAVVSGDKPLYVLLLAVLGFIILAGLIYKLSITDEQIYKHLDDLERI